MAVDEVQGLKDELAAQKKKASDLSAETMRQAKQIGERDNALAEMASVKAHNDQLKAANADLAAQLRAADKALETAAREAAANAAKVAAAEKIAEGLKAL